MIPDFLVRLTNLATNGTITQDEYTTIYDIIIGADRRQKSSVYKELAENLNEQYKGKLVCESIGCYRCFGYPTFKADTDRIMMYLKPYYVYFKGLGKLNLNLKSTIIHLLEKMKLILAFVQ